MTTLQYEIRFVTPAFLGNAKQNGQWRTPPFNALIWKFFAHGLWALRSL